MSIMRIFMGGDVYAEAGLKAVETLLPDFIREHSVDIAVINGENAAAGYGIEIQEINRLLAAGVDVITGGNHVFEKRNVYPYLDNCPQVLRPANFPAGAPGRGYAVYEKRGLPFAVVNLQGREFMTAIDCPFRTADTILAAIAGERPDCRVILVDFHAESNSEKEALGLYLDGRVSALCGTHTHIQTADTRLLPKNTAYITDLGLTGPVDSVIGGDPAASVLRHATGIARRIEPAAGRAALQGVIIDVDESTGCASGIRGITVNL